MDLGIRGKRALVLGANGGLGSAVATALVAEGADVFLAGWHEASLERIRDELAARASGRVESHVCRLASAEGVSRLAEVALERFGGIDILVNITSGPP